MKPAILFLMLLIQAPSDYDFRQDDRHENYTQSDSEKAYTEVQRIKELEDDMRIIKWIASGIIGTIGLGLLYKFISKRSNI